MVEIVVYGLVKNNRIVYVGNTYVLDQRLKQHRLKRDFDTHVILEELTTEQDWSGAERRWIGFMRDCGAPLSNKLVPKVPQ